MAESKMQRALLTGASSGIGYALAKRLALRGVEVWVAARRADLLAKLVEEIVAAGGKAHALALDVSRHDETHDALLALDAEVGGIDLVIANAGLGGERGARTVCETSWAEVRDLFQVNLLGAAATLTPFVKPMVARGKGHLVGVSSIAARLPIPRGAPYGASKAGLTFLLESMDIELRPMGIPVTVVEPGFVRTPMSDQLVNDPRPFLVEVEDAARYIDLGIQRGVRMVRFPWILGAISSSTSVLPRALSAPLIRGATKPKALVAKN
jgi:short-subunit dehydrogenase